MKKKRKRQKASPLNANLYAVHYLKVIRRMPANRYVYKYSFDLKKEDESMGGLRFMLANGFLLSPIDPFEE